MAIMAVGPGTTLTILRCLVPQTRLDPVISKLHSRANIPSISINNQYDHGKAKGENR